MGKCGKITLLLLFMLVVPFAADSKQYIDIAGTEALYPTRDYREIFRRAKRIGQGVRSGEDPELLQLTKSEGIVLEMCPTSNRLTHAVQDMNTYHLRRSHRTA